MHVIDLKRWDADGLFEAISRDGFVELDSCVAEELLAGARQEARAAVQRNGGQYVAIDGQDGLSGPLLTTLYADPTFLELCAGIYRRALRRRPSQQHLLQLLRCLQGSEGQKESWYLHFDSYLITVVVPVEIPRDGPSGDLILLRRRRSLEQPYLLNLLQKLVTDRKPVQQLLWWGVRHGWIASTRLHLKHGSVYLFFGCATLHANEPCAPEAMRATLIFHYGNMHERSALRHLLKR